jgi:hypothetical protein
MSHTGVKAENVQAHFWFLCVNPRKLNCEYGLQCVADIFDASGASSPAQELYTQYSAFIQDDGQPADTGKLLPSVKYTLPGELHRVPTHLVDGVLEEKYEHEKAKHRIPGHKSTVAPAFLNRKTLAMVIGSREYLALNAELYMERYGVLRSELLRMLRTICALQERTGKDLDGTYLPWNVESKKFYPGNFDALLDAIRRAKTKRMVAALAEN